jgi:hypothetical protein
VLPDMQPVQSSNVARIGYEEDAEEVYVEFYNSGTYVYSGVPPIVFEDFERAPSKGKFVNEVLKPRYACHRL